MRKLSSLLLAALAGVALAAPPLTETEALRLGFWHRPEFSELQQRPSRRSRSGCHSKPALWSNPTLEFGREQDRQRARAELAAYRRRWTFPADAAMRESAIAASRPRHRSRQSRATERTPRRTAPRLP
jgi:hypothetical protein